MRGVWAVLLAIGCSRGAPSAEEALARLHQAAERGDARALYELADRQTRWSIDATFKYHQQALGTIEESYPAEVQAREKARFVDGEDVGAFLAAYDARYHNVVSAAARAGRGDVSEDRGRWCWSGMRASWDDIKQRASHDLETVRESASAYKRAAR
jgi:hypothetical protein